MDQIRNKIEELQVYWQLFNKNLNRMNSVNSLQNQYKGTKKGVVMVN